MIPLGAKVQVRVDFLGGSQWEMGTVVGQVRSGKLLIKIVGRTTLVTRKPEAVRLVAEPNGVAQ